MADFEAVMTELRAAAQPGELAGMARFGISVEHRLGVKVPVLRGMAKRLRKDHGLALALWRSGIDDARILASMVDDPASVTARQMDAWVKGFNSWDVCDQVCGNLFDKTPFAWVKVAAWATRKPEYERRAAFALLACLAWHDKRASDAQFIAALPLLLAAAIDERGYVKKAVNWALRNIGKRNPVLNRAALQAAREMQAVDSKAARWIAADAIRELEGAAIQARLAARA